MGSLFCFLFLTLSAQSNIWALYALGYLFFFWSWGHICLIKYLTDCQFTLMPPTSGLHACYLTCFTPEHHGSLSTARPRTWHLLTFLQNYIWQQDSSIVRPAHAKADKRGGGICVHPALPSTFLSSLSLPLPSSILMGGGRERNWKRMPVVFKLLNISDQSISNTCLALRSFTEPTA